MAPAVVAAKAANKMRAARVVVVGAGVAGIAAATRLLEAGFSDVLLLEAERRIGGRIHTVPFADNVVDLGAQWCHGEKQNVVYETVKRTRPDLLESTGSTYDDYKCLRSNGDLLAADMADRLKSIAFNSLPERQDDRVECAGSLGAYVTERFWSAFAKMPDAVVDRTVAAEFLDHFMKFESSMEASDHLFEVSGKGYLEYWLCDGDPLLNWKDKGFATFLNILLKARGQPTNNLGVLEKRVLLNRQVEHIDWQPRTTGASGAIKITCSNGETIEADHVICTVSLGVLKEKADRMFRPPLPQAKSRAIEGLQLGTVNKFFMEFREPPWPADWSGVAFLWREEDLVALRRTPHYWLESVFGFYRVSHQPRLLQGWIIGPHARHMETLDEREVLEALRWLFRKFFSFPVPEPINFVRTQWFTNPHFRGSYSFRSVRADELGTGPWDLAAPLTAPAQGKPLLQFAGEATHRHYFSTVHGAMESGWREAQRLISYYRGTTAQL